MDTISPSGPSKLRPLLSCGIMRILGFVAFALVAGALLTRISAGVNAHTTPAGFGRGVMQGALMPMAMPNLLMGRDMPIYATLNTGVSYKLGYTVGVNGCGALFFGFLYWRVSRLQGTWRSRRQP